MADLVSLSQSINASSVGSSSSSKAPLSFVPPSAPAPKPLPKKTKEQEKKEEKGEQDKKEKERLKVYRWNIQAHRSKFLSKYIPDDIKEPKASDSHEVQLAHQELIRGFVYMGSKEAAVENLLGRFVSGMENIAVYGFKMEVYKGFTKEVMSNTDFLQPDLEEMALEIPDDYIPGPKVRVFLKLWQAAEEFATNGKRPEERNF